MSGRNVFENNDRIADEDVEILGDGPHIPLPELKEGFHYEITTLPSGRQSVTVQAGDAPGTPVTVKRDEKKPHIEIHCNCGPYQGCPICKKYQGDGLNSPDSITTRHSDG